MVAQPPDVTAGFLLGIRVRPQLVKTSDRKILTRETLSSFDNNKMTGMTNDQIKSFAESSINRAQEYKITESVIDKNKVVENDV
jgi:hypothetical protein